jgi:hypothetical protein
VLNPHRHGLDQCHAQLYITAQRTVYYMTMGKRLFAPDLPEMEEIMLRISRILLAVSLITTVFTGLVAYAGQARKPSAAVTFAGTVAAPSSGEGATWGKGTLILTDGSQHAFEVIGMGATSTQEAMVPIQAVGEVFNLKKVSDFSGTYKVNQPEITAGRSTDKVSLTNERGVVVSLNLSAPATATDVTLTPSETGVTVKLDQ